MTKPFLPPYSSEPEETAKREDDRDSLFLQAQIYVPGKSDRMAVRVRNLSAGGMMAEAPIDVERGDSVHVELRNVGDVPGKVAWVAEGRFGIAFDRPVDPKRVRQPVGSKDTRPGFLRKLDWQGRPIVPK